MCLCVNVYVCVMCTCVYGCASVCYSYIKTDIKLLERKRDITKKTAQILRQKKYKKNNYKPNYKHT